MVRRLTADASAAVLPCFLLTLDRAALLLDVDGRALPCAENRPDSAPKKKLVFGSRPLVVGCLSGAWDVRRGCKKETRDCLFGRHDVVEVATAMAACDVSESLTAESAEVPPERQQLHSMAFGTRCGTRGQQLPLMCRVLHTLCHCFCYESDAN